LKEITVRKEKEEEERKATMEDLKSVNTMADAFATYFPIILPYNRGRVQDSCCFCCWHYRSNECKVVLPNR
jgi:hypothetical protein